MDNEALEILKALKSGQEHLIAKVDSIEIQLAKIQGEIQEIRNNEKIQDGMLDIIAARTTRLQARIE